MFLPYTCNITLRHQRICNTSMGTTGGGCIRLDTHQSIVTRTARRLTLEISFSHRNALQGLEGVAAAIVTRLSVFSTPAMRPRLAGAAALLVEADRKVFNNNSKSHGMQSDAQRCT